MDSESDRWDLDILPPRAGGWLGCLLVDGPFLWGRNCVETTRVSEPVSGWGEGGDLEGGVAAAEPAERDCEDTCAGQTRWAVQFCWKREEGLEHRWQGYSFLID